MIAICKRREGGGAAAELHAWRALCRRYAHEWSLQRAPCGLAPLGAGAGGIVVMAPPALSLLRPQTFHETLRDLAKEMAGAIAAPRALGRGGGATAVRTVLPRPQGVNAADWQDVQTVCACAAAAEGNLGAFAVAAFGPSLLEGRETPDLACEYARLLLSGQLGGAQLRPLIPNGLEIPVTETNRIKYIVSLLDYQSHICIWPVSYTHLTLPTKA